MLSNNNFIKWLALKALIKKVRNVTKIVIIIIFLYEIYFFLAHSGVILEIEDSARQKGKGQKGTFFLLKTIKGYL